MEYKVILVHQVTDRIFIGREAADKCDGVLGPDEISDGQFQFPVERSFSADHPGRGHSRTILINCGLGSLRHPLVPAHVEIIVTAEIDQLLALVLGVVAVDPIEVDEE